ncbi:MAG: NADH-quinone oxidoreductase subunit L, partial [Chloroflexi bacterium]|nr:NADH-quinone oxidoreductase subunit L [Chloroflexota bacterium]
MLDAPWIIPLLPLLAFAVNGLAGRRNPPWTGWVSTLAILGSFLATVVLWIQSVGSDQDSSVLYTWVASGGFEIEIAFLTDALTVVMLLVVTGVSTLVSMYAVGYMDHDANKPRFFTWIPLFVFSMIMLVISDNLLQLFIFWEMVGLCSYL